jgi:hypothetical protein
MSMLCEFGAGLNHDTALQLELQVTVERTFDCPLNAGEAEGSFSFEWRLRKS